MWHLEMLRVSRAVLGQEWGASLLASLRARWRVSRPLFLLLVQRTLN